MEKSYTQIWNYLEGKLSTKEEDALMDWIGESERNTIFFDQVVQDFNHIKTLSPAQKLSFKWYWAAASLLLILSVSILWFKPSGTEESIRNYKLADGSQIALAENSEFEYDSLSFDETKWIKIKGTAEIKTQKNEHLLVETSNGYLIMEGKSNLQIQTLKNNDINILVSEGSIRWLNPRSTGEEITMASGEKALFKNDGKTILFNNSEKRQSTFLIFDNYMNL
jgi:ferric-dicitrate binding protein FerR (iron transport regulator)